MMQDQNPPDQNAPPADPPPAPQADAGGGDTSSDDRTMAMLAHLLGIVSWFIGPLIIWLVKKESSSFVDDQGKESVNFQITVGIAYVALTVLSCITLGIGSLLFPVVGIVVIVFCIIAGLAANKGERYRYPLALRLIK